MAQLARVTTALAVAQDVDTVVTAVVEHAASAVGATVSSLSLLSSNDTLMLVGLHGLQPEVEQRWASYPLDAVLPASDAVRTGRPVVVADPEELEARYPALAGQVPEERSTVCLPLAVGDRRLSVISLSFTWTGVPDEPEMEFLGDLHAGPGPARCTRGGAHRGRQARVPRRGVREAGRQPGLR